MAVQIAYPRQAGTGRFYVHLQLAHQRIFAVGRPLFDRELEQHRHLGARLFDGNARLQPPEHGESVFFPTRYPDAGANSHARSGVRTRRNADDGLRRIVHPDALAENRRITMQPCSPVGPAHDRHFTVTARQDICWTDQASYRGPQPKRWEVIPQHFFQDQGLRLGTLGTHMRQIVEPRASQRRENMVVIAEVLIARPAPVTAAWFTGILLQDLDELLRMLDRERAQHHRVEQAVDGGVGADAERQGQYGYSGKGGAAPHQPKGEADVVPEHRSK